MEFTSILIIGSAVLAILYGAIAVRSILKLPRGNDRMQEIAQAIQAADCDWLCR